MIFLSVWFGILFVLLLAARVWVFPASVRDALFAIANVFFLCRVAGGVRLIWWIVGFAALGYLGLFVVRRGRALFIGAVTTLILIFLVLKRYPLFGDLLPLPDTLVTLGLSYILFRSIHVLVDYRDGAIDRRPGPVAYLNYTLSFLTMLSGPIQRYEDFAKSPYYVKAEAPWWEDVGNAVVRMTWGFTKVLILSALFLRLQTFCLSELANSADYGRQAFWLSAAAVSFVAYLYANFSGYMDVVIGLGRIAGFELPENFNRPFSAENIQEFWKRWHITLSEWVRTYLFNPMLMWGALRFPSRLGGSIVGSISVFVAFFVIGAWHGQTVAAIVYGLALGGGAVVHRVYTNTLKNALGKSGARKLAATVWHTRLSQGLTFTHFTLSVICLWPSTESVTAFAWPHLIAVMIVALAGLTLASAAVFAVQNGVKSVLPSAKRVEAWCLSYWMKTIFTTAQMAMIVFVQVVLAMPAPGFVYQVH